MGLSVRPSKADACARSEFPERPPSLENALGVRWSDGGWLPGRFSGAGIRLYLCLISSVPFPRGFGPLVERSPQILSSLAAVIESAEAPETRTANPNRRPRAGTFSP